MENLNTNIRIVTNQRIKHSKASEEYMHINFKYTLENLDLWIPVEYRRTGISIKTNEELVDYLNYIYPQMNPDRHEKWLIEQQKFWDEEKPRANTTKSFFDSLASGGWKCVDCDLPKNPNWARRIQDLKEFGYTIATDTNRYCNRCKSNKTHLLMLQINRGGNKGNGYESWSLALRKRIINLLNKRDVYENCYSQHCLPDHKFPEIRWDDDTKAINPDTMTDQEIKEKFQLLSNQRNQQKREVCRACYQTGKRGIAFGIPYFYKGLAGWDSRIPIKGKEAEKGCIGCAWYDFAEWRKELIKVLEDFNVKI